MLIGLIISGIIEEYTVNLSKGIEIMANMNDVQVVIIPGKYVGMDYMDDNRNKHGYCCNSLFSYGFLSCFDGLIIEMASTTMYTDEARKQRFAELYRDIPHIFISYDNPEFSSITIDNQSGLRDALQYMYQNGAKKFAMLGGPDNSIDALARKQCFVDFLESTNIGFSNKNYMPASFFLESTKEADELFKNNSDADAFICANDILARFMCASIKKNGLIPGKDVSVLGFDDSDFCVTTYPTISSIRTDVVELGKASFTLLMEAIDKKPARKAFVPSKFILRDSIVHRESNHASEASMEDSSNSSDSSINFDNVLKASIYNDKRESLASVEEKFLQAISLLDNISDDCIEDTNRALTGFIDELFLSDVLKLFDIELLINYLDKKYEECSAKLMNPNSKLQFNSLFMDFARKMMKYNQTIDENRGNTNLDNEFLMDAFFRGTLQFLRNTEANYAKFIENIGFLGIKNAFFYLYEKPIPYTQGEIFEIPKNLYLKAIMKDSQVAQIPKRAQKIMRENIFVNQYVDWSDYNRLTILPIYYEQYLFGILACDIQRNGYNMSDVFINQLGGAVHVLNIRDENIRIMNEYEESMRKLKEHNITLDTMSKTDPLTRLYNRRGFYNRVEQALESLTDETRSLLIGYVDMNDLKFINDKFGHDDGDFALRSIGELLTSFANMYKGFVARIGGDEFAFALLIPTNADTIPYKTTLQDMFKDFNHGTDKPYNVTVSIGMCEMKPTDKLSIDDVLNLADELLYADKYKKSTSVLK